MSKKLTVSHIKEQSKKLNATEKLYFYEKDSEGNDDELVVEYYPNFANDKIQEMFIDIGEQLNEAEKIEIEVPDNKRTDLIYFFIIKHFTTMSLPKKTKDLFNFFSLFIKTDYYPKIMQSFPPESINKVFKRIDEIEQVVANIGNIKDETKRKYQEMNLKNRDEIDAIINSINEKSSSEE